MRWLLPLLFLSACGGDDVRYRPLFLDVQGLSGRATRLTVLVFPDGSGPRCGDVGLELIPHLSAPITQTWERNSGEQRRLDFDGLVAETVTIVGYAEDDQGMPIQFACTLIEYKQIESPEQAIQLSMRM